VRIPRDVNGQLLAERLRRHGYVLTRTLRQILKNVASQLGCSIEELIGSLNR
jgi:hypothetical protein